MPLPSLEDSYGHRISYLRISITDRCNERCAYCMPQESQRWLPRADVLTYEEIERVVRVAAGFGLSKIRVTGGEPLVRRGVCQFLAQLKQIPGVTDLGLSTNGSLLAEPSGGGVRGNLAAAVAEAGVGSVNVSLDSLDALEYAKVTGRDYLPRVLGGIDAALTVGLTVKLNAVLTAPMTRERMRELLEYAAVKGCLIRFIELMPVSTVDVLHESRFVSLHEAKATAASILGPLAADGGGYGHGPAVYYRAASGQVIGFIGAMTDPHFCDRCNKLRLTCDGKLRPCLGSWLEFDIKEVLRKGASDDDLAGFLKEVVARKPKEHDFSGAGWVPGRPMVAIGG